MPNMTLAIPKELHKKMSKHKEIRWSEVVRKAIEKKVRDLELLDRITSKSRLTEKDIIGISSEIDKRVAKRLGL